MLCDGLKLRCGRFYSAPAFGLNRSMDHEPIEGGSELLWPCATQAPCTVRGWDWQPFTAMQARCLQSLVGRGFFLSFCFGLVFFASVQAEMSSLAPCLLPLLAVSVRVGHRLDLRHRPKTTFPFTSMCSFHLHVFSTTWAQFRMSCGRLSSHCGQNKGLILST